jgi:hypothetical protein
MSVLVLTRDLMDGSRFRSSVPDLTTSRTADPERITEATLVIVDLSAGFDLVEIVAVGVPVIAYGAHVDTDALDRALAAGCIEAVPRSRIVRRVQEICA